MAFDQTTRNRLARFVSDARTLLTEEFTRQLQNEYGLDPDHGGVTRLEKLTALDDTRRETARILRETMDYYLAGKTVDVKSQQDTLQRIVREQAFTVLNRLCALRMAESRGIIIESISQSYQSKGFQLYARLAGTGLGETGDAYRSYLFSLFDEFAVDLAVLFDRFNPQGRLFPRQTALITLLELVNNPEIEQLWAEDETIGWIYQYFNTKEERQKMRAASQAPRNSRELAVRNQFFTPRYVVEFLTDNTLGRIWYEMAKGETILKDLCRYLVRRPTEIFIKEDEEAPAQEILDENLSKEELLKQPVYIPYRPLKDPRDLKMLDPACGSMHFGLYAFDLFEQIYVEAWNLEEKLGVNALWRLVDLDSLHNTYLDLETFRREVPRLIIERNIHGVDIDPRAVQIAGLSLWLRAQKSWQAQGVKPQDRPQIRRSNIVCAEPMPGDKELLDEFLETLNEDHLEALMRQFLQWPAGQKIRITKAMTDAISNLVRTVWQEMALAGEAGSLLKIEDTLRDAIAKAREETEEKVPLFRVLEFGLNEPAKEQFVQVLAGELQEFWNQAEGLTLAALQEYAEEAANGRSFRRRLFAEDAAQGFAFIDLCRKHYDVVVMNPPFGDHPTSCLEYLYVNYPDSKIEIYCSFISRSAKLLSKFGAIGALTTRNGYFLGTLSNWRSSLPLEEKLSFWAFSDLGAGVLDDSTAEAAATVFHYLNSAKVYVINILREMDKDRVLLESTKSIAHSKIAKTVNILSNEFYMHMPRYVFAYWVPEKTRLRFKDAKTLTSIGYTAKQGIATSNNYRFIRDWQEVQQSQIGIGKTWLCYAKGGTYQPFFSDSTLLVNWSNNGKEIKAFSASLFGSWSKQITNTQYFNTPGLTYSRRTRNQISPSFLPPCYAFDVQGSCIFPVEPGNTTLKQSAYLAGIINSRFFNYLLNAGVGPVGNIMRTFPESLILEIPIPNDPDSDLQEKIGNLSIDAFNIRRKLSQGTEGSRLFEFPWIVYPPARNAKSLHIAVNEAIRLREFHEIEYAKIFSSLDQLVSDAYDLSRNEHIVIDTDFPLPNVEDGEESKLRQEVIINIDTNNALKNVDLQNGENEAVWHPRWMYFHSESIGATLLELKAGQSNTSMTNYSNSRYSIGYVPPNEIRSNVIDLISYITGCVFGRWDIRSAIGGEKTKKVSNPFASLPVCPPGMLQNAQGLPASPQDLRSDYPLRIIWNGILADDEGHSEDVEGQVRQVQYILWGERVEAIEAEACQILGVRSLREYFQKPALFFADHLKRYSKSRRQAPIYWPLSTSSGSYTLWLYYHRLGDQILFTCVNDFIDPKLKQASEEAGRLRQKKGRSTTDEKELERLTEFERELKEFREELLRVAKFWKPDLNDGVQITAAPLWKLFQHRPWQKKLKETWESLESGEYDWAHLAYSIWPERVTEKCKTDKSLAIAHDLEHLYVEPKTPLKKRAGRKKQSESEMDELFNED